MRPEDEHVSVLVHLSHLGLGHRTAVAQTGVLVAPLLRRVVESQALQEGLRAVLEESQVAVDLQLRTGQFRMTASDPERLGHLLDGLLRGERAEIGEREGLLRVVRADGFGPVPGARSLRDHVRVPAVRDHHHPVRHLRVAFRVPSPQRLVDEDRRGSALQSLLLPAPGDIALGEGRLVVEQVQRPGVPVVHDIRDAREPVEQPGRTEGGEGVPGGDDDVEPLPRVHLQSARDRRPGPGGVTLGKDLLLAELVEPVRHEGKLLRSRL